MNKLEVILDNMRDGILLLDGGGIILQANKSFKKQFNRNGTTLDHGSNIFKAALAPEFKEFIKRHSGRLREEETELEMDDYNSIFKIAVVPVADGEKSNLLLIFRNITKQRQLEKIRRDFVANVSHELKTPITGIKLLSDAICQHDGFDDPNIKHFAGRLGKETGRLVQLVNDLLDLSKLETVKPVFEFFDLAGLVKELKVEFEVAAEEKDIEFNLDVDEGIPLFFGSPEQMELMVANLIENALRYTMPGGKVAINLYSNGSRFLFQIADTGIGIPAEDIGRVFERFYRVDKARSRKKGGTGLGLSIVKHVVQNHNGEISIDSRVGAGSKFAVSLPR